MKTKYKIWMHTTFGTIAFLVEADDYSVVYSIGQDLATKLDYSFSWVEEVIEVTINKG